VDCRVWLYALVTSPPGRLAVVTASWATTTMLSDGEVAARPLASLTLTVKLEVPAVIGFPAITPAALRFRPCGRLPDASDQL